MRKIEIQYDVVVAGGGPAGIAAAVSSARCGARTAMIERFGIVGGMLTSGYVQPILGKTEPWTMYHEICGLLEFGHEDTEKQITRNGSEIHADIEEAKYRLLRFADDNKVDVFLQTAVADVVCQERRVTGLVISTPLGLCTIHAEIFVDATGDGFVAYSAGAEHEVGRDDGKCQPVTVEFTLSGVDETRGLTCFGGSDPVTLPDGRRFSELCSEACRRKELPQNVSIVRLHRTFYNGERQVNATQANGFDTLTASGIIGAELELRGQIDKIVNFLQRNVPGYERCAVKASGSALGVRESRRIMGDYVLTDKDVESGSRFPDAVVHKAWFLIDIHNPSGGGQAEGHSRNAKPYDIPLRCLIPRGVDGLLLAGRCISGTHRAHASYRVMGIAMATGQSAGIAAALCAQQKKTTRELNYKDVQKALTDQGARLYDTED